MPNDFLGSFGMARVIRKEPEGYAATYAAELGDECDIEEDSAFVVEGSK
jgi:hypothetical protein